MGEKSSGDPPDRLIPFNQPLFTRDVTKKLTINTSGPKYLVMCRTKNINDNETSSSKNVKNVTNGTLTNVSSFLIKKSY